ncbi:unnamed protein product [Urochloa humidicola]
MSLLEIPVAYSDGAGQLLHNRRNGHGHLLVDYAVDRSDRGQTEAALFGAQEGMKLYRQNEHALLQQKYEDDYRQYLIDCENYPSVCQKYQQDYQQYQQDYQQYGSDYYLYHSQVQLQQQQQLPFQGQLQHQLQQQQLPYLGQVQHQLQQQQLQQLQQHHHQHQQQLLQEPQPPQPPQLPQPPQPPKPLNDLERRGLPYEIACLITTVVTDVLKEQHSSPEAAKMAAAASAKFAAIHPDIPFPLLRKKLTDDAFAEGMKASLQQPPPAVPPPRQPTMFTSEDVDHMYHLVSPYLLAHLQVVMLFEQECFRLTEDRKVPRLT